MAKLILKATYTKNTKEKKVGDYVKYIATRDGVEKVSSNTANYQSTKNQDELIQKIVKDFPDSKELHEYTDYIKASTRANASEFIATALESNMYGVKDVGTYMHYIATRPNVEVTHTHGLFGNEKNISLKKVSQEVSEHGGNIWTFIVSLRREDASKLDYDNAKAFENLIKKHQQVFAKEMKIDFSNFIWYGAYHDAGHHPHIHVVAYSKNEREGYLSKVGINTIRSKLANDIFRDELHHVYAQKTAFRDQLRDVSKSELIKLISKLETGVYSHSKIETLLVELSKKLQHTKGRKVYGYLQPPLKELVNKICCELEQIDDIKNCYTKWCEMQDEVLKTYKKDLPSHPPLSSNQQFKHIKNIIIKEAMRIHNDGIAFYKMPEQIEISDDEHMDTIENIPEPIIQEIPTNTQYEHMDIVEDVPEPIVQEIIIDIKHEQVDMIGNIPTINGRKLSSKDIFIEWNDRYKLARFKLFGDEQNAPDFEMALQLFKEEAESGNALAKHDLGRMYADGLGCEKDMDMSYHWYQKALQALHFIEKETPKPYLHYRLGKMYNQGLGTEQDHEMAARWYQKAVDKNHKYAQYSLGGLYHRGYGVEQSNQQAFDLYLKSALQGNPYADYEVAKMYQKGEGTKAGETQSIEHYQKAFAGFVGLEKKSGDDKLQYRIGYMFMTGTGTQQSIEQAVEYFEKSARVGNVHAKYQLAKLYLKDENCPEEKKVHAIQWLKESAEDGNEYAQYQLGKLYQEGTHVEMNIDEAIKWFICSAEQDNEYASYSLGKIYLNPELNRVDVDKAIKWLTHSAEKNNQFAQYQLGKLYQEGTHVEMNIDEAIKWFICSAEQDNEYASYSLGKIYLNPKLNRVDVDKAIKWLTHSAEKNNQFAQYQLGKLYQEGTQGEMNIDEAIKWYICSAEQDNEYASYSLGKIYLNPELNRVDIDQAIKWLTHSAEKENQYAQCALGLIYLEQRNIETALKWLMLSAKQENDFAMYQLGKIYLFGNGVKADKETAKKWFASSAERGNQYAQYFVENMDKFGQLPLMLSVTNIIRGYARAFRDNSAIIPPEGMSIDRKTRRKIMEKKMAQGHKSDDHISL